MTEFSCIDLLPQVKGLLPTPRIRSPTARVGWIAPRAPKHIPQLVTSFIYAGLVFQHHNGQEDGKPVLIRPGKRTRRLATMLQYMIIASALVVAVLLIGLVALGIARGYNVKIALRSILMLELTRPWQLRSQPEPSPHATVPAQLDPKTSSRDQPALGVTVNTNSTTADSVDEA